jgi:gamma-glutamylaminecyclotransferase
MSYLEDLERLQAQLGAFSSETPEYAKDQRHFLFVYGTMKRGLRNHKRLEKAKFVGEGVSVGNAYLMWTKRLPGVPGKRLLAPVLTLDGVFRIRGEVYEVDGPTLAHIDLCEGHPVIYERMKCDYDLFEANKTLTAWTYMWGAHAEQRLSREGVRCDEDELIMEFAP